MDAKLVRLEYQNFQQKIKNAKQQIKEYEEGIKKLQEICPHENGKTTGASLYTTTCLDCGFSEDW